MLDISPENLLEECQAAEKHAKKTLAYFSQIIQVLVGSYYRDDMVPTNPSPENYPYSYLANVKPRLVFNNPRFNASTASTSLNSHQVLAQAAYVNRWTVRNNLQAILDPWVATALLQRSVILTSFEDDPTDGDVPEEGLKRKECRCTIIENPRYFRDPVSTPAVKARYKGHYWVRDLEEVQKFDDLEDGIIEQLVPDADLKVLLRPNDLHGAKADQPPRHEIVAYEVWVPECNDFRTDPKTQHGTIFTIAYAQTIKNGTTTKGEKVAYLRKPRPYFGPAWGPYTELEYIAVPGQTYGTSPVAVVMQQVEELNAHLSASADAAARMKHLVFVDAANDTLQIAVQNSPDGSLIGIPGLTQNMVQELLVGGPAKEQYEYIEVSRQRLDRNIGMDASQRGGETSDKTATATNVQYETLNVRMADLKRITSAAVKQLANTVSWYAWNSNNVVMRLAPEDAEDMGIPTAPGRVHDYYGGPQNGEELPEWETAALDLEPYSMEAPDEEKLAAEVTEALAIVSQMAQEMQTAPWLGWDTILEQFGKIRKFDWLHDCINGQLFAEWMKEQVQQQMEAHQSEQALTAAKIESMQTDNALKKAELMARLKELQEGPAEEGDKPPFSMNYKDLPEDKKRDAETRVFGSPSTQPLTSPAHVANAMTVNKTNAGMQHDRMKLSSTQKHDRAKQSSQQDHQLRQSKLAGMFKTMSGGQRGSGGMGSRRQRAGKGPTNTGSRGQKAFARTA